MHPTRNIRVLLFGIALISLSLNLPAHAHHGIDETLESAGGTLLIDWRGEFSTTQQDRLRSWLISVSNTVRLLHGELPQPEIRYALQPYRSRTAVPFARVLRNKPEGVLFYVNPDRPLDEFINDWTAYHELAHLFIPYPGDDDLWFSEGLASYYQNILQARAGLLSKQQAIDKLVAGFERGVADTRNDDLTLAQLSKEMRERMAFMRVYWSGALYFLEADITLRSLNRSNRNINSLDAILREYGKCCRPAGEEKTGLEIAGEFDRIAATRLFVPLYKRYAASLALPEYKQWLDSPEMDAIFSSGFPPAAAAVK